MGGCIAVATIILLAMSLWAFYGALRIVSRVATGVVWCFVAMKSADALMNGTEEVYFQMLSFWVLATLWSVLTRVPYAGALLGLTTPMVLPLLHVASDTVVTGFVLPLLGWSRRASISQATAARASISSRLLGDAQEPLATDTANSSADGESEGGADGKSGGGLGEGGCTDNPKAELRQR